MIVDQEWMRRNLGFDHVEQRAPANTYTFTKAADHNSLPEDQQREIIDFDSEAPEGKEFFAFTTATVLSRFTDIPWPKALAPQTGPKPTGGSNAPLSSPSTVAANRSRSASCATRCPRVTSTSTNFSTVGIEKRHWEVSESGFFSWTLVGRSPWTLATSAAVSNEQAPARAAATRSMGASYQVR